MRMLKLAFLACVGMLTLTACSEGYDAAPYPASVTYVAPGAYVGPPPSYTTNPSPVNVKHYPNAYPSGGW